MHINLLSIDNNLSFQNSVFINPSCCNNAVAERKKCMAIFLSNKLALRGPQIHLGISEVVGGVEESLVIGHAGQNRNSSRGR